MAPFISMIHVKESFFHGLDVDPGLLTQFIAVVSNPYKLPVPAFSSSALAALSNSIRLTNSYTRATA